MTARCIITSEVDSSKLRAELAYLVTYFQSHAQASCRVLFGFAWGNEYYAGDWIEEEIPLSSLIGKIQSVEESGFGRLGRNDLFIKVSGMEFRFCHESDLHLEFVDATDDVEHFYNRWGELGYGPSEWLKEAKSAPKIKTRAYGA